MRFSDRLSSAVLCCLFVALVLVGLLSDASAQHPEGWPEIVLAKSLGSVYQLYGVMADGAELDRLYPWPDLYCCSRPVLSPDGGRIAYRGEDRIPEEPDGIYCLDLRTGTDTLLMEGLYLVPAQWAPDGEKLLVAGGVTNDVWVVDSDGLNPLLLATGDVSLPAEPRWLPNGSAIVYASSDGDPPEVHIWAMDPDGSDKRQLTFATLGDHKQRPSPDGSRIVFRRDGDIWMMDSDGANQVQLTSHPLAGDDLPRDPWSPDGQHFTFASWVPAGGTQMLVCVMDRDGTNRITLADDGWPEDWSPGGERVLYFEYFEPFEPSLWTISPTGTDAFNLGVDAYKGSATWGAFGIRRVYAAFLDVTPDTTITVPVNVDTCLGVAGMQIELTYDPDILECTGVVKGPLLPGSWAMPSPNIDNVVGNVKFLAYDAGATPLPAGSGEIFTMSFHVKATAPCCTTSPLHFVKCLISDEWGDPILMTPVDGAVTTPTPECSLTIEGANGSVEVDGAPHALPWTGSVPCGTEVALLAVPDSGYEFSGWSGDLTTTDNPAYLVVDESKTVTAEFSPEMCSLTILGANGSVVVDGVPYALPWSADFTCGTEATVEAVPDSCYVFVGWSGDVTGTANPVVIAVDGDLIVTAGFGLVAYTLSLDKTGSGYIATDGEPRALPWSGPYACGSSVGLEAVPQGENWVFDQWSGDLTGSANPTALLIDGPKSVTASFLEHSISLSCSATPDIVYSGGTTNLASIAADSIGHSLSMYWEDLLELDADPVGAMGSFSPSPYADDPAYVAPENTGDQDLSILLQVTATCDGDPSLVEATSCTLTVKPCAAMTLTPSDGTRGETARVPVVVDLLTSMADRLSFTVAVTPIAGAPAVTESLGFEAAAGLPAPGLVSPTGNQVSVAWLSSLTEPLSGSVPLGDVLVPVPAGADLGDLYSVCLTVVGASLGGDEICVEAGECATLFACVEILAGDCYRYDPPMADENSDEDTCDWGEYNDDALSWGDVITTFDAWTIPGVFTCGAGSHRYNAMDCYPRDGEPGTGPDGAISWGDVITTFDRWTGVQEIAWRPICWVGELEVTSEPRVAASFGRAAAVSEAPSLQLADVSGEAGSTLRMPVVLDLHGYEADRLGFSVEVAAQAGPADAPVLAGFEAAAGLPNPMTATRSDGGLAVAWMMPIETALTGSVALGELVFELPAAVTEEMSWQVSIAAAGASLGESELEAAVSMNDSAAVTVSPAAPHDVGIARLQAPGSARAGATKTLTIVVENLTETAESVIVRLRRGSEVVREWTLELSGKERQRLRRDYRFDSEDIPRVEFTAEVVATADDHPENNIAVCTARVR